MRRKESGRGTLNMFTGRSWALLVVFFLLSLCASCSDSGSSSTQCVTGLVETTSGTVCGKVVTANERKVHAFLGIPFGESTAGDNRWRDPIPKDPVPGIIRATEFGPGCPQEPNPPYTPSELSEDCLSLNIWHRADLCGRGPRPVMVWVYGGSFLTGGTSVPIYDGAWLASSEDLVVVSINYRVGALGFLAGIHGLEGNYGLKDQQLALKWVQDNIAHFGGDPNQVTIFGESAGAMSVGLHSLSIPSSNGLFQSGIMQSNPLGIPYKTVSQAGVLSELLEELLNCGEKEIECLRAVSANDIVKKQSDEDIALFSLMGLHLAGFLVWSPAIDGSFVMEDPTVSAEAGGLKVPTILGTTHDEGVLFVNGIAASSGGEISAQVYLQLLNLIFGADNTADIIALYGIDPTGDNSDYLSDIVTDYLFGCANRFVASHADGDLWAYEFNENSINIWPEVAKCEGKACHADDIPFTFHTDTALGFHFTPEQDALSRAMIGYWGAFASQLNPNTGDSLFWPLFTPSSMDYMVLVTPELYTAVNPIPNCEFWDRIGYDLRPPSLEEVADVFRSGFP